MNIHKNARLTPLRLQRLTGRHIAYEYGVSAATVSRILRRAGLNLLRYLDPAEPILWSQPQGETVAFQGAIRPLENPDLHCGPALLWDDRPRI